MLTRHHHKRFLHQAMGTFNTDFPAVQHPELFICGYSAGAMSAGCARPHPPLAPRFPTVRYVLASYPVEANPAIGVFKSGSLLPLCRGAGAGPRLGAPAGGIWCR